MTKEQKLIKQLADALEDAARVEWAQDPESRNQFDEDVIKTAII